jgi:hypothetical protein
MAAASFSLTAVFQDTFQLTETAQQQAPATATPVNPNQAQGAPSPSDTVTLANQAAEGQRTGQDPNPGRFDRAAFVGAVGVFVGANRTPANTPPNAQQAPALPVLLPRSPSQNAPAASPANTSDPPANQSPATNVAANAANAAAVAANAAANAAEPAPDAAAATPQQQLQQLDQALLQLGINPQSIPLANRMAMLLYANDPAALHLLVQALQTAATQQGSTQTGTNTAAQANAAATLGLLQTAAPANQGQPAQQPASAAVATQNTPAYQPAPHTEVLAAQINFADVQATLPNQPAQAAANQGTAANAANTPALSNPLSVQIEELQIAIQAIEIQPGQTANLLAAASPSASAAHAGSSLNVTA